MRLLANIPHPSLRISIFTNENRFSLKFESGLYEQTFKFRDGDGFDHVDAIVNLVTDSFCKDVIQLFNLQHEIKLNHTSNQMPRDIPEFPVII
ncbi:MAG: hypothetical protein ACKOZZ_19035 [Bacteroidota bacterium]